MTVQKWRACVHVCERQGAEWNPAVPGAEEIKRLDDLRGRRSGGEEAKQLEEVEVCRLQSAIKRKKSVGESGR